MRKTLVPCFLLLLATITSSCSTLRAGKSPLDYRDSLPMPAGTTIKDVPFYINGKDKPPTKMDFVTDSDGAFMSDAGIKAVQK